MEHVIALSHASGIAAEAILEKLPESGVTPDSLVLLDHDSKVGKRLPFADGYLSLQDQYKFDLSNCALLLMPEADAEMESLALSQGCLLLSHALENDSPALFVAEGGPQPDLAYTQTSLRLAGAELSSLLPVLLELDRVAPIEHINITFLRSAEFHGKAGVDELASQTINLLNTRSVEPGVYAQQIAFNLLPETTDPHIETDIRRFLGNNSYSIALQTVNVPIFHGLAAAVQLRFASNISFEGCKSRLAALANVAVEKGPVSPISDCNQSFNCVISQLEQAPEQPSDLRFWLITDPMRYGLANNYVNVSDFLLKSFL
ncbi:MAG: Asd/ArgC dimerization domain-containing protein [Gammaproteobacteria bacterium]